MTQVYRKWVFRYMAFPSLQLFLHRLPFIPIAYRKILLAITRIQQFPNLPKQKGRGNFNRSGRRFCQDMWEELQVPYDIRDDKHLVPRNLMQICDGLQHLFEDPVTAGLISISIRSSPLQDAQDARAHAVSAFDKELLAALGSTERVELDFRGFMSYSDHHRSVPIAPNVPSCDWLSWQIFSGLLSAKSKLKHTTLYPRLSTKTISKRVSTEIEEDIRQLPWSPCETARTIEDLERIYYRYGWMPRGETEMRSAWKYNDLKPRVYYAQGPDVFASSKYIQQIFNTLLDQFPVCHRILRFSRPTADLQDATLHVYDYSSFTSSLIASTRFIFELADFFDDCPCRILDTRNGFLDTTVGSLLREYAVTCNVQPEFSVSRLLPSEGRYAVRFHSCGMLGVPGNLASCTLLHAIHLMYITGSMDSCRCVGDDGLAIISGVEQEDIDGFIDQVNNLGEVGISKTEYWTEDFDEEGAEAGPSESWQYTKRPIYRHMYQVMQGRLFIFPSLELILQLVDKEHTSSLEGLPEHLRHQKISFQLLRLLSDLSTENFEDREEVVEILLFYLRSVYKTLGWVDHRGGVMKFPMGFGKNAEVVIPILPKTIEDLKRDPYEELEEELIGTTIKLPAMRFYDDEWRYLSPFCTFTSRGERMLTILRRIGVVRKGDLLCEDFEFVRGCTLLNRKMLKGDYFYSYEYEVLETLPSWSSER